MNVISDYVEFRYQIAVTDIEQKQSGFELLANGKPINCDSLVIATGGLSMPKLGATPFGYQVAEQFDLKYTADYSRGWCLFTLHKQDKLDFNDLSGVAIPSEITAEDGTVFKEALLFTHRGLSGPAVLQISSYWEAGQKLSINLVPEADVEQTVRNQS